MLKEKQGEKNFAWQMAQYTWKILKYEKQNGLALTSVKKATMFHSLSFYSPSLLSLFSYSFVQECKYRKEIDNQDIAGE